MSKLNTLSIVFEQTTNKTGCVNKHPVKQFDIIFVLMMVHLAPLIWTYVVHNSLGIPFCEISFYIMKNVHVCVQYTNQQVFFCRCLNASDH